LNYPLPANAYPGSVSIAYQSGGTATVAYVEVVSTVPLQTVLHVGVIPPGGTYQEQLRIASTTTSIPAEVRLAEAPDGAAVVEWTALQGTDVNNSPYTYLASYREAGSGNWESPTTITSDSTRASGIGPYLVPAISADGTAAAGVDHLDATIPSPGGYRIDIATHQPGGSWGGAAQISPPSDSSEGLALGFDAHGDLTAAFRLQMSNGRYTLAVVRRPATSGIWGSLEDVTGSDVTSDVEGPVLGVAGDGSAVIAFQYVHFVSPSTLDVNAVTRSGATGTWTAPVDVASGGASSAPEAAGVSSDDKAYVLYTFQGQSSGQDCVGATMAPVGGTFTNPSCVSATNFESGYKGALAFLGHDAYFAWSGQPNGGTAYTVEGSRWLDGASEPDSFTDLDSPGPGTAMNALVPDLDGGVVAYWTNSQNTLRAAAFDGGGPNLLSANVPSVAVSGLPVTMSAGFADLWSGLAGSLDWSFGDGSSATGGQVTHTYAAAGTYTVTVTAQDGLGNETSATYPITVSAAVVPTPVPVPGPQPVPGPTPHGVALQLSGVGQSAPSWREAGRRASRHKRQPIGTTFRFTLNQAASVRLTFTQAAIGRRFAGRCIAGGMHHSHEPRCKLTSRLATITVSGRAGRNQVQFKGIVPPHRKLAPGRYTVTITATAATGAASSTLGFTIVNG
jgi:PKD repeat protein